MHTEPLTYVFIHGAWHGAATWDRIVPLMEDKGHRCVTLDLPGAGSKARKPASFFSRPIDRAAFAAEPSPNAGVTQAERTAAVLEVVRAAAGQSGSGQSGSGKVVVVGHSMGGVTLSAVAEAEPDLLQAAVYLAAFMLPPGMPAIELILHPRMASALVPPLLAADPNGVGALRIDTMSDDPDYSATLKAAFYGDVEDAQVATFRQTLHCDEPTQVVLQQTQVTRARFGRVARHYIICSEDMAMVPQGPEIIIPAVDDAMGNLTRVHTMATSHSPFLSQPEALADLLNEIGLATAVRQ